MSVKAFFNKELVLTILIVVTLVLLTAVQIVNGEKITTTGNHEISNSTSPMTTEKEDHGDDGWSVWILIWFMIIIICFSAGSCSCR